MGRRIYKYYILSQCEPKAQKTSLVDTKCELAPEAHAGEARFSIIKSSQFGIIYCQPIMCHDFFLEFMLTRVGNPFHASTKLMVIH